MSLGRERMVTPEGDHLELEQKVRRFVGMGRI
jgi:hypothetical protein